MSVDLTTLVLAKKYTGDSLDGLGALKGAPCIISAISEDSEGNTLVTFQWTGTSGATQTQTATIKKGSDATVTEEAIQTALGYIPGKASDVANKVDKITGKGLSTNDFTNAEKTKVDAIPDNPKYTDTIYDDSTLSTRIANIEEKETTWDNKQNALTQSDKQAIADLKDISGKVDKITGKGLSTNDYTSAEKTKLANLSNYDDSEIKSSINTKIGYAEVSNGVLYLYNNSTDKTLIRSVTLPSGGGTGGGLTEAQVRAIVEGYGYVTTDNDTIYDDKYTNTNATTMDVGGIAKGTTFDNVSIKTIIQNLLYPYVAFTFSSLSGGGTYEYGTSVTVNTVKPVFTNGSTSISSCKVGTTSGGNDLYNSTSAPTSGSNLTLSTAKTYDGNTGGIIYMTLSDGTTTLTKSTSVSYSYYNYYALNSSTEAPTSGTKMSSTSVTPSYAVGNYLWLFSQSKSSATIQTNVMGQWVDVNTTSAGQVDFTLASGKVVKYYAYRTDQFSGAGSAEYRLN